MLSSVASARPHRIPSNDPATIPLRVVLTHGGVRFSNCVFGAREVPERTGADVRVGVEFGGASEIWGRCYLPDPFPGGEAIDVITIDHQPPIEILWDHVSSGAFSRLVAYGVVLRDPLSTLAPGTHRVQIEGQLKRGAKRIKLYMGEFVYVR
jgi:hypothetical protein